jgi:hypothetical protein
MTGTHNVYRNLMTIKAFFVPAFVAVVGRYHIERTDIQGARSCALLPLFFTTICKKYKKVAVYSLCRLNICARAQLRLLCIRCFSVARTLRSSRTGMYKYGLIVFVPKETATGVSAVCY